MLGRLQIILAVLAVGAVALTGAVQLGKYKERQRGTIQQLQNDIRVERERVKDDAKTRNLSDYDFCIQSLRRRGVRTVGECEELRGLAAE